MTVLQKPVAFASMSIKLRSQVVLQSFQVQVQKSTSIKPILSWNLYMCIIVGKHML